MSSLLLRKGLVNLSSVFFTYECMEGYLIFCIQIDNILGYDYPFDEIQFMWFMLCLCCLLSKLVSSFIAWNFHVSQNPANMERDTSIALDTITKSEYLL